MALFFLSGILFRFWYSHTWRHGSINGKFVNVH